MSAPSPLQLTANRANALLSTGPRSPEGKQSSSRNAQSHGLTSRDALLPGEDAEAFEAHRRDYLERYHPQGSIDHALVIELADLHWRLRRVPAFEAQLLSIECHRLRTDPELKPLIEGLDSNPQVLAVAFTRLVENRVLPNLQHQEARLSRRAEKLQKQLDSASQHQPLRNIHQMLQLPEEVLQTKNEPNLHPPQQAVRPQQPGRNEPCSCGSGVKYKRCCWNTSISSPNLAASN